MKVGSLGDESSMRARRIYVSAHGRVRGISVEASPCYFLSVF